MNHTLRRVGLTLSVVALWKLGVALACSCSALLAPEIEYEESSLVFAGEVVAVDPRRGCEERGVATVRVDEAFKGTSAGERIEVHYGGLTSCDVDVHPGDRFLLMTESNPPVLQWCAPHIFLGVGDVYEYGDNCGEDTLAEATDTGAHCTLAEMSEEELLSTLRALVGEQ